MMEAIERTVRTVPRLNCASMSPCSADDNKQLCHIVSRRGHKIIVSTTTKCSLFTQYTLVFVSIHSHSCQLDTHN